MKPKIFLLLAVIAVIFASCHKETEQWSYCTDCDIESWIGNFKGNGQYYDTIHYGSEIKDVEIDLNIENIYNQTLKITVSSPHEFSWEFTGQKSDNDYYLNIAGTLQSISLNLYKNDKGDFKFSGVAKKYKYNTTDSTYHTIASATFEVFKEK